ILAPADFDQLVAVWSRQRDASVLHQLFRFSVETDDMHGVLRVVSMFIFEFSAVNVFLSLLTEQSFHLVVCESEEWLHMPLRNEKLRLRGTVVPRLGRELKWREQEMQSRWIALSG